MEQIIPDLLSSKNNLKKLLHSKGTWTLRVGGMIND